jgi:hypothetical protein
MGFAPMASSPVPTRFTDRLSGHKVKGINGYRFGRVCVPAVTIEIVEGRHGDQSYCRRTEHTHKCCSQKLKRG